MSFRLPAVLLVLWLCATTYVAAAPVGQDEPPIDEANFIIRPRTDFEGRHWVYDQDRRKIIGYATSDDNWRRYTLFDLNDRYAGFMQATISGPAEPRHHKQYLWYNSRNEYRGVLIRDLGGQVLPPFEIRAKYLQVNERLPGSAGKELGGQLILYPTGAVAIDPPEADIRILPWHVDQLLDQPR